MESVLLIAKSAHLLPQFRQALVEAFPLAKTSELTVYSEQLVLEFSSCSRIYIENYGSDLANIGWEDAEIKLITKHFFPEHWVYAISYRSIELVKQVVHVLADSNQLWVDNDCGTLLPGADFGRKMREQPSWSWFDDLA